MKKNIILSAIIIFLCLAVIYLLNTTDGDSDLISRIELQTEEMERLSLELDISKEEIKELETKINHLIHISEARIARIEQLTAAYPPGIWKCDSNAHRIIFEKEIEDATLGKIIAALNESSESFNEPSINLTGQDKGDVYLTVSDSEQLAERMGSAGAICYLGKVVYSITSIEGINSITFDFKEGSHASPGEYDRLHFEP